MNLNTLHAFLKTAELGNFSIASRYLGLTPAAISKSVGELEQTLGLRLFHRNTRTLSLTEDGKRLRNDICVALDKIELALNRNSNANLVPTGRLKINIPESFGKRYILPLVPKFLSQYPSVELDIHLQDKKINPISEGFDISIGNLDNSDSGLITRELCKLQLVTIASPLYLEKHSTPKKLSKLIAHNLIAYRQLSSGRVVPWGYKVGGEYVSITPSGNLTLSKIESVVSSVINNLGIGCVGLWHVRDLINSGALVELFVKHRPAPLPVKIYYPSREQQPKKVRVFIDFLLQMAKNNHFDD
jgi:DNA-binding transcriptional LysR family regulator